MKLQWGIWNVLQKKGTVNHMKKKNFMTKVTMIDCLVVLMLLITGLVVPAFRDLISTMFFSPFIYAILCINLLVDLLLLVLNKFKKGGNILKNFAAYFLILKLFALFMACLVFIVIGLTN